MKHAEHEAQKEVVRWLRAAGIQFCAVPNGGSRSPREGARLKAEGVQAGVPDLLIFDPPPADRRAHSVAIEMKSTTGSKPRPEQLDWQVQLGVRGWRTLICYGAADALSQLAALGYRVPAPR